jgi:hypothetical protein
VNFDPLDLKCEYCGITAREVFGKKSHPTYNTVSFSLVVDDSGRQVPVCGYCLSKNSVPLRHGGMGRPPSG